MNHMGNEFFFEGHSSDTASQAQEMEIDWSEESWCMDWYPDDRRSYC